MTNGKYQKTGNLLSHLPSPRWNLAHTVDKRHKMTQIEKQQEGAYKQKEAAYLGGFASQQVNKRHFEVLALEQP
jgi:hypothetical protein